MLRVSIMLVPHGDESKARSLGTAEIGLCGVTPDRQVGSYEYKLLTWTDPPRVWKRGNVSGHHRTKRGPWDLLYRILADAVKGRNRDVV